jgi:hypothetical protein
MTALAKSGQLLWVELQRWMIGLLTANFRRNALRSIASFGQTLVGHERS